MRKETVPEDMSSEQKVLLGMISIRQLIYIIVGATIIGNYLPIVSKWLLSLSWVVGIIGSIISIVPVVAIVGFLGFYKNKKYHMFYDSYLIVQFKKKYQYGIWRKGDSIK